MRLVKAADGRDRKRMDAGKPANAIGVTHQTAAKSGEIRSPGSNIPLCYSLSHPPFPNRAWTTFPYGRKFAPSFSFCSFPVSSPYPKRR
jgi:hypothetical protein